MVFGTIKDDNYDPPYALQKDMQRIKAAGFNTLRTWMEMPDFVYELAAQEGLYVLTGIGLPLGDLCDSAFRKKVSAELAKKITRLRKHPNIIGYLLINEPEVGFIEETGPECVQLFFEDLIETAHQLDPFRPVTCTPWVIMWPTDMSCWDMLTYNTYRYFPSVVSTNMTYARFIDHIRHEKAEDRAFVITEFGYPVNESGAGGFTYGGNSLEEQATGIVALINALVAGGVDGGCVFEWNDEWWKPLNIERDEFTHEDDPEEYFGLIAFKNDKDVIGTPRPAYYAISNRYQALTISPARQIIYTTDIPVRVYTANEMDTGTIEYTLDGAVWTPLSARALWQSGLIPLNSLQEGGHTVDVRRVDKEPAELIDHVVFYTCSPDKPVEQHLSLFTKPDVWRSGAPLWVYVKMTDPDGVPISNWPVKISTLQTTPTVDSHYEGVTGTNGEYRIQVTPNGEDKSHLIIWAACDTFRGLCPDYAAQVLVVPLNERPPRNPDDYNVGIRHLSEQPEIDGKREELWGEIPLVDLSLPDSGDSKVLIRGIWDGNDDFSGAIYARWDEEALYLLADVRDASPMQNKWNNAEVWRGDGLEIFMGTNPDLEGRNTYSDTDFQFILAPEGKTWIYGQASGGVRDAAMDGIEIVTRPDKEGYVLEARIPWSNFAFVPHDGDEIKVEFNLNNAVEGQGLPTKFFWATDGNAYRSPEGWGRAVLISE